MELTRGAKICYNLAKTPYKTNSGNLCFCFSSEKHLQKFKARLKDNRDYINKSLSRRFGVDINVNCLADILLYRKIETRGFLLIDDKGVKISWQRLLMSGLKPEQKQLQKP